MPENARNYQSYLTKGGVKVNIRLSRKVHAFLVELVRQGYYLNVNDAIRDGLNFFLAIQPWKKRITGKTPITEILEKSTT
jgi:Arc/MetJ-type ribon-helix-helix transcriptional regulator